MSQSIDKPNTNVPTDLVLGSGIVFREVRKTWNRATKAEMRLELLKNLQVNCLGLPDVEHFVTNQAQLRQSYKFRNRNSRDPNLIKSNMSQKLRDAYQEVREATSDKFRLKRKLESTLKKSPSLKHRVFNQLSREAKRFKSFLHNKNLQKIDHLETKFKKSVDKSIQIPDALKRYQNIKIYSEEDDAPEIDDTGVDIIGDVHLDEDELSVLRLPPDFAVLGRLSEEEFMVEVEMAMTKLRWEKKKLLDEELDEEVPVTDKEREIIEEEEAKS